MKKNYFLVLSLYSILGFSQQVLKRITDTPTQTIVELFALRNGSSLPNTTGESNFDAGISDGTGNVIVYNPSLGNTYSKQQLPSGTAIHSTEQIGNGTFPFDVNQTYTLNNTNFVANGGSGATLPLLILQEDGNADSTQDSNNTTDLLYSKFYLPKTLTDGNPIPTGLIAKCLSRLGLDNNTGASATSRKQVMFTFDGTNWNSIYVDWLGVTIASPSAQIDSTGQLLSVNEFLNNSKIKLYPNPTNKFITIQNQENERENFEYKIIDLTGRIVKNNNSKFNEEINVETLQSGNYIIQIKSENGEIFNKKLIKTN